MLADVAAALLGHGRDGYTQHLAVGDGIEAQVGCAHGLVNFLQDRRVPGRDQDQLRLGRRNLRQLADWGVGAVVVDLDLVEHVDAGPASARGGQVGLEGGYGAVHAVPQVSAEFLERRNAGHE